MTTITGVARLNRKIGRMPARVLGAMRDAMEVQAKIIVAMMKSLVPVDSGDLRDSIGWTWGRKPLYSQAIVTVKSKSGDQTITIYAGNYKVRYAHLVEFGAAAHIAGGRFKGAKHPGAPAQPFFFVSWRANRKRAGRAIRGAMRKAIKTEAAS